MTTPGASNQSSVFAVNPALRQEYGPVLDYLAPKLTAYSTVFGVSEREAAILRDKAISSKTSPADIRNSMKEMYPDQPIDAIFKTDNDLKLLGESLGHLSDGIGKRAIQPEVSTLRVGNDQAPVRIGFITLPEKFEMTPETHIDAIPHHKLAFTENPKTEAQRRSDYKAFVVSHEVSHLADEAEKGTALFDFDDSKSKSNRSQKSEVIADRGAFVDMPDMVAKGLIKDPEMLVQIEAARKIETFQDLVQKGEKWTVGSEGTHPGKVVQDKNLDTHGTGFSIHSDDTVDAQNDRMTRIGKDIADARNATLGNMLEQARDGKSTPEANKVYEQIVARSKADSGFIEKFVGKPVDAEEGERLAFNKMITRDPDKIRDMADEWQKMPSVPADARGVAGDYAAAYDYLIKGKKPEASLESSAASPKEAASLTPASASQPSEPVAVSPPPSATYKPPVQAPG